MNGLALFNELFDIAYLLAFLVVFIGIWFTFVRWVRDTAKMQQNILDLRAKDTENARIAAESVRTLAAILQNEQAKDKLE